MIFSRNISTTTPAIQDIVFLANLSTFSISKITCVLVSLQHQRGYSTNARKPINTTLLQKMSNNIHSRLLVRPQTPACALDYEKCTTKELRKFFEERTGTPLNEEQLQKVREHGSYPLIDLLRQMDREERFPRFMELVWTEGYNLI